jgi:hypothetical protein
VILLDAMLNLFLQVSAATASPTASILRPLSPIPIMFATNLVFASY